jgi:nucleoside-diphosphate-sugar epimerase
MNSNPTIIITGAGGFLGSNLVTHFSKKGWHVIAFVRQPDKYKRLKKVSYVAYDLSDRTDDTLFKGADYLVHAAYMKQDSRYKNAFEVNVEAAKKLLAAGRKYQLKKNIFISSMSAHEDAVSVYGKQKLAIEKLFNTKNDLSLRCGLMLGDGGIVRQMVGFMKSKHVVPLIDDGKQPLQIVAMYDLVRVIESALTSNISGSLTIATPEIYTYKEFYQAIARRLKIKVAYIPVPFAALLGVMRTVSFLHLPLAVSEDNLWGLKKLRSAETAQDLRKLRVKLDGLDEALRKTDI